MSRGLRTGQGLVTAGQTTGTLRPIAYTPAVVWAGNTITTQSGFYLKTPGLLQVWVSFIETVGTATAAVSISLPAGYTAVSLAGPLNAGVGIMFRNGLANVIWGITVAPGATATAGIPSATGVVDTWVATMQIPTLT